MPALASPNDIYHVRSNVQDILKRSLRLIGVLASGDALPPDQLSDGLEALNDMLDSWNTESMSIWVLARKTFTLTLGLNPHEIGPGSAILDAPRPNRIEQGQAWLTGGQLMNIERELKVVTRDQMFREYLPTQATIPTVLYYEDTFPTGNIWFPTKPDFAYTLVLYLEQMLQQTFSDGTTSQLDLPPGYKEAIVSNLAVKLAPEYGKTTPVEVINSAVESKANIKRLNRKPLFLNGDIALMVSPVPGVNILRGDF